jgi:WS/DGAT/MGAT family acyltransferase
MKHLTGADTTFLYTETPTARLEVATCMVLDGRGQPRGDALLRQVRDHLVPRLHLAPLLRRRLVHVPLELDNPVWVEDPDFDVDAHLHRRRLPRPGTMAQLGDAVGEIMAAPLDRSRPLWDLHVIEGLAGRKVAIVVKTHHAAVDGVAGFELLSAFVDLEPGPDLDPRGKPERPWAPEPVPRALDLALGAAPRLVTQPLRSAMAVRRSVMALVRTRLHHQRAAAVLGITAAPVSPFNRHVPYGRIVRFCDLDLEAVKEVKRAAGATVNDVVLAVVGGALRRHLERTGELPDDPLVAFMPVSLRDGDVDAAAANLTSVAYVALATDEPDPRRRLERIAEAARAAKAEHASVGPPALVDLTQLTGTPLGAATGRLVTSTRLNERFRFWGNVVVSNIRGLSVPIYLEGSRVERLYPMGPITDGTALNITLLSMEDRFGVGVTAAGDAVAEPDRLVDDLVASLEELRAAVVAETD